jgi:hypothetical protein
VQSREQIFGNQWFFGGFADGRHRQMTARNGHGFNP